MAVLNPLSVSVAVTPTPKKRRKVQTEGGPTCRGCGACGEVGHRRDSAKCPMNIKKSKDEESEEQKGETFDRREEQKGETFDRRHMSTHAHVCLTSSQIL
jgi:hypothetical protein